MLTTQVHIPQSAAELADLRREEIERNEKRTREQTAEANRAAGKEEPKAGSKLYVATARGIKNRGRAGLMFSQAPAEVKVVEESDAEIATKQKAGAYVVNTWGAEQILADSHQDTGGLVVFSNPRDAGTPTLASETTEALEAELARRKAAPKMETEKRIGTHKAETDAKAKHEK